MTLPPLLRRLLPLLLILAVGAAAFSPGLGGRFLFDDYPNILSNRYIHMETLDATSLSKAARAFESGPIGRPLATISFALDHWRGGRDPAPYKVTSLLVHLLNGLLVFALAGRVLALAWPGRETRLAALAVALAWTIHPLQVSTVLYIVQRMEMLSLMFVLLGLLAYLRGRVAQQAGRAGVGWLALSAACAATGLLAKESAILFPLYALALELTVLRFAAQDAGTARRLKQAWIAIVVAGAAIYLLVVVPHYLDPLRWVSRDFTLAERMLTQLRVLPMYLGWMLLPLADHLLFYYDQFEPSRGLFSPWTTAAGGLLLAALLAAAVALRRRAPLFALGVLWFFAAHAITSNIVPLELVFEHRNYFALLGVVLAVADGVLRLVPRDGPGTVRLGVGAVLAGLVVLCVLRAATWGNPFLLATDLQQRNPQSARAANDLGEQFMILAEGNPDSPYYQFAEREFERASHLPRASVLPEQALILLAATAGRSADPAVWDRMAEKLEQRAIAPQDTAAVFGLLLQRQRGIVFDDRRFAQLYEIVARKRKLRPAHLAMYADHALVHAGDPDLAERLFVQAVDASVDDPDYMVQLAEVLLRDGHRRHAEAVIAAAARHGVTIR